MTKNTHMRQSFQLVQKHAFTLAIIAGFLCFATLLLWIRAQPDPQTESQANKPRVAVTLFPLYDVVRTLGEGEVDVQLIVAPGASPHTFTFTPQGVAALQGSQVIFAIGQGLDTWIAQAQQALPGSRVVYTDRNVVLREMEEPGQGLYDPHYYLSLVQMQEVVRTVATTLKEIKPERSALFESRAQEYVQSLASLHAEIESMLAPYADTSIVTMHDAWGYFAADYGLSIAGTFEPSAGEEPTPQYLAQLQRVIRKQNVRVLFAEPQLSTATLQSFAKDMKIAIAELDPEGGLSGRETYLAQMRYNATALKQALIQHDN
jgi:zinc transport system substrate-binding protein